MKKLRKLPNESYYNSAVIFLSNVSKDQVFTYSETYMVKEIIKIAELQNVVVEYCPPNTPEYKAFGCQTMKVIKVDKK